MVAKLAIQLHSVISVAHRWQSLDKKKRVILRKENHQKRKKVACARAAIKAIRNEYYTTAVVEKVYIRHSSFRTEAVYVMFENGDDYICYVFAGEAGKADTRKNYGYSDTREKRAEEFEKMADWIKRGSLPILPMLVDAS